MTFDTSSGTLYSALASKLFCHVMVAKFKMRSGGSCESQTWSDSVPFSLTMPPSTIICESLCTAHLCWWRPRLLPESASVFEPV